MNLLKGEKITFTHLKPIENFKMKDEEINNKYIKGEVRIVTEQARYPLPSIIIMLSSGDYKLNPEFQRRHRWNKIQKSKLIESFIMNVPIPPIFLYEDSFSHYEVMDGLQRLTAIKEFYSNEFELEGLEEWPELNGKKYSSLPIQIKKGIDRRYLSSIILLQETAKNEIDAMKLKQLVFERINSGGVQLEPQESRNAVYNGRFNELCIKLARNEFLCKTWNIPVQTSLEIEEDKLPDELIQNDLFRSMRDVELVLRFFANRQRSELIKYTNSLKSYLNNYLRYANLLPESTLKELSIVFEDTMKFLYELLGEKAFYLYRERNGNWNWFSRPTTAVFDPLTLIASDFLESKDLILSKKDKIEDELKAFYQTNYSMFGGRNTNPGIITERERLIRDFFKKLTT
ncbi:DUF262 domain-containing protein [Tenacibaculum maritimum]|uniref:DUF262 domain-containing protein n=1 Tax=Tenacibaculum maritimum TaxID=107401 RepID=UPI001E37790E|nr:DUF262 domain-containing protein [Tenacibaculum maritimum]MCD9610366.1 DUF262 domain-containing protein [Tenacibaculum maritimum]